MLTQHQIEQAEARRKKHMKRLRTGQVEPSPKQKLILALAPVIESGLSESTIFDLILYASQYLRKGTFNEVETLIREMSYAPRRQELVNASKGIE